MKTSNVILGVLSGFAAGAALGVLYAPEKGSSTRKKIQRESQRVVGNLGSQLNHVVDGVAQQYDTAQNKSAKVEQNLRGKS
jgi:gas vesicle protein